MTINAQYNVARPDSLPVRIAGHQRRRMYDAFLCGTGIAAADTILDVGATSDRSYGHSNYVEAWYPHKSRITALGVDDASFLQAAFPGVTFVQGDGRDLPFDDASFDFVHSSAVMEHVGSQQMQVRFLREAWRVARKGIFVTTPNRWFPIEFHTLLPLLHWLPPRLFRQALARMGRAFFASEENLNLMSRNTLAEAALRAEIPRFGITTVALAGWPTNLLLWAEKGRS